MEITCNRCHQTLQAENCYCSVCGLPQLVYPADGLSGQTPPERWDQAVRDAGSVDWKPALRAALKLAIPAGLFCSVLSPLGILGLFWMAAAATWAVALYLRSQRPAWITIGAGARIGLVTGLVGAWTAVATSAVSLFALRFFFHQGSLFDSFWQTPEFERFSEQWTLSGFDVKLLNSPEGHCGMTLGILLFLVFSLVAFAIAGGALGARMLGRTRQPEA
jgi:hypothetical protein